MFDFIGRLHLLLLHLPIGVLGLAFLLETLGRWRRRPDWRSAARLALGWGVLAAALAAGTGWLLAGQGGYDDYLLFWHRWLGVGTAALALSTWLLRDTKAYFPVLTACALALTGAGHFGGSLTHGADYLLEKKSPDTPFQPTPSGVGNNAPVFQTIIQPVLKNKCVSCHGPSKKKGGLALDTPEGLASGGKNGAVLLPGSPDSSPLLQRALLPLHHDDHMPPAGKPQPTPDELALLRWWIAQGADFQKTLGEMTLTPEVEAIVFQKENTVRNPVFDLKIEPADASDLAKLRAAGASVMPLGVESPWLAVSFAGNRKLDEKALAALRNAAEQIVDLDLSNTNLDDRLLAALPALPHLTRLHLAQTAVGDAGLAKSGNSPFLEFLNLTGTKVGDAGLESLSGLKNLRALYAWRTGATAEGLARLEAQIPGLKTDAGASPDTSAAPLPLRPPRILYARNIFDDTVQVALDFPRLVGVYYTLDEASPTTRAIPYEGKPLIFNETTKIRAIAAKPGWADSPVVEASFVKRKHRVQSATLAKPPSPKYPGDGAKSLFDGRISDNHLDKTYLGYEGEHLTATLDLGEEKEVGRVSVHCLENNGPWIFAPRGLRVWTSADGKNWTQRLERRYPVNAAMQPAKTHLLSEPFAAPVRCRYVKVLVESLLKNPPWHPGKGQKCWVFVDEILVE